MKNITNCCIAIGFILILVICIIFAYILYNYVDTSKYNGLTLYYGSSKHFANKYEKHKWSCAHSKIVISGLIREGENKISSIRKFCENIGSNFQEYHVLIVENDSTDKTRQKLLEWQSETPDLVTILGCGVNARQCLMKTKFYRNHEEDSNRISALAHLRNIYLDHTKSHFSHYDYLIVCDFDLYARVHIQGLEEAFQFISTESKCNAVSANSRRNPSKLDNSESLLEYYDQFAYLPLKKEFGFDNIKMKHQWDDIVKKTVRYNVGDTPYEVQSAFGGFTIYKIKPLLISEVKYNSFPEGKIGCEHVYFHQHISGVYFHPSLLVEIFNNPD